MAENVGNVILQQLEDNVLQSLDHLNICNDRGLKLIKKTRDYKSGDIIIPVGCVNLEESKQAELLEYVQRVYNKTKKSFVSKVSKDRFSLLSFYLDRAQFFLAVFKEIQDSGKKYGCSKMVNEGSVFLNCFGAGDMNSQHSLTNLRLRVISQHVEKLLKANGYAVISQAGYEVDLDKFINEMNLIKGAQGDNSSINLTQTAHKHSPQSVRSELAKKFIERARLLSSSTNFSEQIQACGNLDFSHNAVDHDKSVYDYGGHGDHDPAVTAALDIQKLISDRSLCFGSGNIDKNLQKVAVIQDGKLTDVMEEAIRLGEFLQGKHCCHCLHVVPHYQVFRQQQVQLTLAVLSDNIIHQSQLTVGPVISKVGESSCSITHTFTFEAFFENRYLQMKEASEMRNGGTCPDQILDKQTQLLTSASIKLDLLSNTSHTSLHIDASSRDQGAESRLGAFVLYNTARLATLMSHFSHGVQEGLCPPLPPVEAIDFSLLREEDDWELVFQYLAAFPDVVRQSVDIHLSKDGKYMAKIHTHKVTNFLVAFTKCLSAHYSRYHVLTGGEAHLLPLMYARLYLMKSAHQVLVNCLQLVGVEALSFL